MTEPWRKVRGSFNGLHMNHLCGDCVCTYFVQRSVVFISFVCVLRVSLRFICPLALTSFLEIKFYGEETEIVFKLRLEAEHD